MDVCFQFFFFFVLYDPSVLGVRLLLEFYSLGKKDTPQRFRKALKKLSFKTCPTTKISKHTQICVLFRVSEDSDFSSNKMTNR